MYYYLLHQIFEICLILLNYDDSSIVVASLECLQALFKFMPFKFNELLTNSNGYKNSMLNKTFKKQLIGKYSLNKIKFNKFIQSIKKKS